MVSNDGNRESASMTDLTTDLANSLAMYPCRCELKWNKDSRELTRLCSRCAALQRYEQWRVEPSDSQ
jgi:hypothetical protein